MNAFWPLSGVAFFLFRPHLWKAVVLASLLGNIGISVIALALMLHSWPEGGVRSVSAAVDVAWRWLMGLAGALLLFAPIMKGRAGRAVLRPVLCEVGHDAGSGIKVRGLFRQSAYLVRTIPLRCVWIAIVYKAHGCYPLLGVVFGMWGIGHLVVLDACDQVFILLGVPRKTRMSLLDERCAEMVLAGAVAGVTLLVLGMTGVGWLIWAPGCFCGAALWVVSWLQCDMYQRSS